VILEHLTLQSPRLRAAAAPFIVAVGAAVLLVAAVIAAEASTAAFVVFGVALVALVAVAAVRWPRTAIVLVVLSPIIDRYLVADMLPEAIASASHYLSEALLLTVTIIIAARSWADGRLVAALRHPVAIALIAFTAVAAVSAVINGVPPHIAILGLVFTVEAAALFFLPILVGFSLRQASLALGAVGGVVLVSAVLAIGQVVLHPRLFGMEPYRGKFGEGARLASVFGDPNVFGAFLVLAVPFGLLGAIHLPSRRLRWLAGGIALVLMLALWLSFSRGAWIALVLGVGTMLAVIDRRALLLGLLACVVTFVAADNIPRNLLLERKPPRPRLVDSTVDRIGAIGVGGDLRTLFVLQSIPVLQDHPVLGVGPGRFGGAVASTFPTPIYEEYGFRRLFWNPAQRTVDNFWLHVLVETGVVGAAAFLAAALIPGVRIVRAARAAIGRRRIFFGGIAAAAAGLVVVSGTTMLLEANSIGFAFWFILGLGALVAGTASAAADRDEASATAT
jgi:O-antigen ligase